VLIVLDSPAGGYPKDGGGETAAPVFSRVAQQVLAYMNVPHDVDVQDPRRMFIRAHAKEDEVFEGAPDHIASEQASEQPPADTSAPQPAAPAVAPTAPTTAMQDARLRTVAATSQPASPIPQAPTNAPQSQQPVTVQETSLRTVRQPGGTIVLDVAGGALVPDFRGKSLRRALEEAEAAGLELEISGSGVGQSQSPAAGSRIPPGGHVNVRFGR
jgi:cell division protein FtsI (penicillin-binding protein 3)